MKQPLNLTAQESAFASEHHNIVENYLQENNLSKNEYYDVIIFGYLNSVIRYMRMKGYKQYDFSTLARKAMDRSYLSYVNAQNRRSCEYTVLGLHEHHGLYTWEETIADTRDTSEEVISSMRVEETLASFTEREREIVKLLMEDCPKSEILSKIGLTANQLREYISEIQAKTLKSPLMQVA